MRLTGFGCTEQAPRAGTALAGVSGPAGHRFCVPGSLPGRSGRAWGALCAQPSSGWDVRSQPALNGDTGSTVQPDPGLWDTQKLPWNTELLVSPRAARGAPGSAWARFCFAQPGALGRPGGSGALGAVPAPHTKPQPRVVFVPVPPPPVPVELSM